MDRMNLLGVAMWASVIGLLLHKRTRERMARGVEGKTKP
jgi:hypothetical protein